MILKRFLVCLVLFNCINISHASVSVNINGSIRVFNNNPRLAEVLAPVAEQAQWYWPSTQLFNLAAPSIAMQRNQVLDMLLEEATTNSKVASDYQAMASDIQSWRLADRIQIEVDFDLARFSLINNPQFENGEYLLQLSHRATQLQVFGAVPAPITIDFVDNQCVDESILGITRLSIADVNNIYVISPDANITQIPIAYWNKVCFVPMPGSLIYIPIKEHQWLTVAKRLNQQIVSLVLNRVQIP